MNRIWIKMLLTVLIHTSFFSDVQARFAEDQKPSFLVASSSTASNTPNLCAGISVNECASQYPQEIKQCKVCGLISSRDFHPMIINGDAVDPPFKYPWMAALIRPDETKCGAAIISDSYVLSAAHCLLATNSGKEVFFRPNEVSIGFVTSTDDVERGPPVEKVIPHPEYCRKTKRYDFALIKLKEKITCGKYRNPICLPSPDLNINIDAVFHYTGWGTIVGKEPHEYPKPLMEGTARLVNISQCKIRDLKDHYYCFVCRGNTSPCFGDSGGPMFYLHKKKYYAIGVANRVTHPKCNTDKPFIYAAIPKYVEWIEKIAGPRIKP